jgi:MSHA biogenesis protein MshI
MRLFGSKARRPGWFCINVLPGRVDVCHVNAAGRARPEILLCDSYRQEGGDAETLARLRRELDLDRHRCTTLLKSGDYQVMQVESPNVPRQEAKSAVRWRIKDMIDYPVEGAVVDAVFIPAADGAAARSPQMLVVSARNEAIAASVKPFNDADIALEAVDIPDLAQRNLAQLLELEGRALALLVFDDTGGLLTFTCGGELYQSRRIEISLKSFESTSPEQRRSIYDRLILELHRSLDHFDRQFRHVAVARVMVTPVPGADELRGALAASLDVPVALVRLSEIMDFPRIPDLNEDARQAQCLQLIGAAMREEATA